MTLIESQDMPQQAHLCGVDMPVETKLLFARMLCFQPTVEPTKEICELNGEYTRPMQAMFTKERVKATEQEIREAWGVVLDGVKKRYESMLANVNKGNKKLVIHQVRMYERFDKARLRKSIQRTEALKGIGYIRGALDCVVTFPPLENPTLPAHPTSNPPPIKGEGSNEVRENVPLNEALEIAKAVAKHLSPHCERIQIAGSVRRGKATVKDIELVVIPRGDALWKFLDERLLDGKITKAVYSMKNGKPQYRWGEKYRGFVWAQMKIEIFAADASNWGYLYLLRTGPHEANVAIMTAVQKRKAPFSFKDGRVWNLAGEEIPVPEEKDVYKLLGMEYVAAEKRSPHVYWKEFNRVGHEWGVKEG